MPTYKYLNDTGLERTLSKLKTYIDSQSGGGSDGHGFIICDTSTMQVGDRIRVRSVYTVLEEPYNQTKEVVTIGQPVVFTVPCYDYYKICTVQTIDDTPTEMVATYRTVDYGQTIYISSLNDKTSLVGAKGIVNGHQEANIYNIGDTLTSQVGGSDWVWQVALINGYDSHDLILVSRDIWTISALSSSLVTTYSGFNLLQSVLDSFYNAMADEDKAVLDNFTRKSRDNNGTSYTEYTSKIWLPNSTEVVSTRAGQSSWGVQFPLFVTQQNRIRRYNNTTRDWYISDFWPDASHNYMVGFDANGQDWCYTYNWASFECTTLHGILPCIRIKADS